MALLRLQQNVVHDPGSLLAMKTLIGFILGFAAGIASQVLWDWTARGEVDPLDCIEEVACAPLDRLLERSERRIVT